MAYTWNKDLETGYKVIDDQHRELVAAVNSLNEANRAGRGSEEIMDIVLFLIRYANNHFRDEEALQLRFDYPDYFRHKSYHIEFKARVDVFAKKLMEEGVTMELIREVTLYIGDWLIDHIKGDDFALAAYIQSGPQIGDCLRHESDRFATYVPALTQ